jgi:hypothetical protein
MGFDYIAEILHHPHRMFKLEEKQFAIGAALVFLWKRWDYSLGEWIKTSDINGMYIGTLQREQVSNLLLSMEVGVHGRA